MGGNPENAVGEEVKIMKKTIEESNLKTELMSHLLDDVKLVTFSLFRFFSSDVLLFAT